MKIAVATNDETRIAGHVGRCNAFIVYTINDAKIIKKEVRENTFTHHKQHRHHGEHNHGEGHSHGHGHSRVIDALKDCEALIFTSGGRRIVEDLKSNNIKPILTDEPLAEQAALKYALGELEAKDENICNNH